MDVKLNKTYTILSLTIVDIPQGLSPSNRSFRHVGQKVKVTEKISDELYRCVSKTFAMGDTITTGGYTYSLIVHVSEIIKPKTYKVISDWFTKDK